MEALGRVLNIVPVADNVEVSLKDAAAVTFVLVGADTYTVQEAQNAAGGGAQNLPVIERSYSNASQAGANAWVEVDELSGGNPVASVAVAGATVKVITVRATSLSDGYSYVRCASAATGLVYAITHDLHVQRAPQNLPALAV